MTTPDPGPDELAAAFDARLSAGLGGPGRAEALITELDRAEQYPEPILGVLNGLGLADYYVPPEYGGRLVDLEELLQQWRTLARRDLSLLFAHGTTYLCAEPVWLAGSGRQAAELAEAIRAGTRVGCMLAEPDRNPDPAFGEVIAEPAGQGYRLRGTAWPVSGAARGELLTVFVRTGPDDGPRSYSLLMLRRDQLAPEEFEVLPTAGLHGVRGVDLSGIRFDRLTVPGSALVGTEGTGLATALRAPQLTRLLYPALSLGAGEHALRLVTAFAARRAGQRWPLIERASVRAALARAVGLLTAAEAAAVLTARSVHSLTEELSVLSGLVRGLTSSLVDTVLAELTEVLGPHSFLAAGGTDGVFQKVVRDHQTVTVLDGGVPAVRNTLINQFPWLVSGFLDGTVDRAGLEHAARVGTRVGPLDRSRLLPRSRGGCSAVQALPGLAAELDACAGRAADEGSAQLARLTWQLAWLADEVHARCVALAPAVPPSAEAYDLAAAYELLYAGAALLQLCAAGQPERARDPRWGDTLLARTALVEVIARTRRELGLSVWTREEWQQRAAEDATDRLARAVAAGEKITPFGTGMVHDPEPSGREEDGL
jgi:alkylation response protein AidB-like acyl-CoA dehydrogenase